MPVAGWCWPSCWRRLWSAANRPTPFKSVSFVFSFFVSIVIGLVVWWAYIFWAGPAAARLLLGYVVVIFKRGQVDIHHGAQTTRPAATFFFFVSCCWAVPSKSNRNSPAPQHSRLSSSSSYLLLFSSSSFSSSSLISQGFGYLGNRPPFDCQSFRPTAVQSVLLACLCFLLLLLLLLYSSSSSIQQYIQQTQEQHQSKGIAFGWPRLFGGCADVAAAQRRTDRRTWFFWRNRLLLGVSE